MSGKKRIIIDNITESVTNIKVLKNIAMKEDNIKTMIIIPSKCTITRRIKSLFKEADICVKDNIMDVLQEISSRYPQHNRFIIYNEYNLPSKFNNWHELSIFLKGYATALDLQIEYIDNE